jgi:rSAM/selenodomain-associated transferase 1
MASFPEKLAAEYEREDRYLRNASLVAYLRYPRPGSVKTRLGATLGDPTATDFYRKCATHLSQEVRKLPKAVDRQIWYVGGTEKEMVDWLGRGLCYLPQPEGSLGTRLTFALNNSFQKGAHKVIALASDVPDLIAELIVKAFRELDRKDMVIGPTFDGGYYLIGLKQPRPELFQGISWSTNMVYQQTLAAAERLGISYHSLTTLNDIDTREDLLAWRAHSSYQSPVDRFARSLDLEAK